MKIQRNEDGSVSGETLIEMERNIPIAIRENNMGNIYVIATKLEFYRVGLDMIKHPAVTHWAKVHIGEFDDE